MIIRLSTFGDGEMLLTLVCESRPEEITESNGFVHNLAFYYETTKDIDRCKL